MNKKGQASTELLMKMGKILFGAFIFLAMISGLWGLWGVFFAETPTLERNDFENFQIELTKVSSGSCLPIIVQGENYRIELHPPGEPIPDCAGKACLCLIQGQDKHCEAVKRIKKECKDGRCVKKYSKVEVTKDTNVQVCRRISNELSIKLI